MTAGTPQTASAGRLPEPASIGFKEALDLCLAEIGPPLSAQEVPVIDSLGRVLREDVVSPCSIPPFTKAVMDGFALRRADIADARPDRPATLLVTGSIPAGCREIKAIGPGESMRIMTGAAVPAGADAVIPMEETRFTPPHVRVLYPVRENPFILAKGHDVQAGATLLTAGIRIRPPQMGLLAACGRSRVRVARPPVVGILSTGNELAFAGRTARTGQVYDINGHTLFGMVRSAGADARLLGIAPDSCDGIATALDQARDHDLLVISGGFSRGDYDKAREALIRSGVKGILADLRIMDGKPIFFGRRGRQRVFGLPGNPVSTVMNFRLLILPVLEKLMGRRPIGPPTGCACALNSRLLKPGGQRLLRGRLDLAGDPPGVWILAHQRSGMFHPLAEADVLLEVPAGETCIKEGQRMTIYYLHEPN